MPPQRSRTTYLDSKPPTLHAIRKYPGIQNGKASALLCSGTNNGRRVDTAEEKTVDRSKEYVPGGVWIVPPLISLATTIQGEDNCLSLFAKGARGSLKCDECSRRHLHVPPGQPYVRIAGNVDGHYATRNLHQASMRSMSSTQDTL